MNATTRTQEELAHDLMLELSCHAEALSLPRLCKRLGVRQSSLLRCVSYLGEEALGQHHGAGWVRLLQDGERTMLALTEEGRRICQTIK